jgi:hypothetical protein
MVDRSIDARNPDSAVGIATGCGLVPTEEPEFESR